MRTKKRFTVSVPAAFIGVVFIWSTTPLAIKWSSDGAGFLFGVGARMLLGLFVCQLRMECGLTSVRGATLLGLRVSGRAQHQVVVFLQIWWSGIQRTYSSSSDPASSNAIGPGDRSFHRDTNETSAGRQLPSDDYPRQCLMPVNDRHRY